MISVQFNFPNDSNKYSEKFSGITDSLAFLVKDDITLKAFIEGLYYGLHNNFPEHFILFKDYLNTVSSLLSIILEKANSRLSILKKNCCLIR